MLQIVVPESELFDDETQKFIYTKKTDLKLEHSLLSLSKWESNWKQPFLNTPEKTKIQSQDYVKCMTLNPPQDNNVYKVLTEDNWKQINNYVETEFTATWFHEDTNRSVRGRPQIYTSELIYYNMITHQIPIECQKWHLSRLLTLIKICNIKANESDKKNKMSKNEIISRNKALNEQRKKEMNTKG